MPTTVNTVKLGRQFLTATLSAADANKEARTIPLTWYSGAVIRRQGWDGPFDLSFDMSPSAVRLERLASGTAPLLDSHRDGRLTDVIGVITGARLEQGIGKAEAKLSQRPELDSLWRDLEDGIVRNASMGAIVHKLKETTKEGAKVKCFVAVDWEPCEVSLVAVGADPAAGVHASAEAEVECEIEGATAPQGESEMPNTQLSGEAERLRCVEIANVGRAAKLAQTDIDQAVSDGMSLEAFRKLALDKMREHLDIGGEIQSHYRPQDSGEVMRTGMLAALVSRATGSTCPDIGREWRGRRLPDFARSILRSRGMDSSGSDNEAVTLAMGTSDFPGLLSGLANKLLMQSYLAVPGGIRVICKQSTANDFKLMYKLRMGEYPALLEVPEHAEVKSGPVLESKESYAVRTYGRIISLTRQAIVNDDLAAFSSMTAAIGKAAADFEANFLVALLTANGGVGPAMDDTNALFSVAHANLATGAPSALGITALSAARTAMRLQTGVDGVTLVDASPKYLLVPASLQTTAEALVAALSPPTISDVNPFAGKLEVITEPRLDAISSTRWYLAADQNLVPSLEVAYLAGQPGPQIMSRVGFEILGVQTRVTLDYGAGAVDHRGLFANNGV